MVFVCGPGFIYHCQRVISEIFYKLSKFQLFHILFYKYRKADLRINLSSLRVIKIFRAEKKKKRFLELKV